MSLTHFTKINFHLKLRFAFPGCGGDISSKFDLHRQGILVSGHVDLYGAGGVWHG